VERGFLEDCREAEPGPLEEGAGAGESWEGDDLLTAVDLRDDCFEEELPASRTEGEAEGERATEAAALVSLLVVLLLLLLLLFRLPPPSLPSL
jgi:hypothetical protein